MGDGEPGAQRGAIGAVEAEQRFGQAAEPAREPRPEVAPGPCSADALAFQVQVGDLVEGIDGAQARVELQAVDNPDLVVEPDVLGPQISVPVDDAMRAYARFQHAAALGQEAALDAINAPDGCRWQAKTRVEQHPAVLGKVRGPCGQMRARGQEDRARPPIEARQRLDQPVELPDLEPPLAHHLLQSPPVVEAAHDHQPVGDRARASDG
jgi:hypothetical protein